MYIDDNLQVKIESKSHLEFPPERSDNFFLAWAAKGLSRVRDFLTITERCDLSHLSLSQEVDCWRRQLSYFFALPTPQQFQFRDLKGL